MRTVCIGMDGAIDLATLAGGLKGDDQQKVAAGIGIAAVPGMACLGNAAPLLPTIGGRSGFPRSPSEMRGVAKRSDVAPDIEVTKAVSLRGKLRSGEASTLMRLIAAADAREPKFDDCVAVGPFQSGENRCRRRFPSHRSSRNHSRSPAPVPRCGRSQIMARIATEEPLVSKTRKFC